MSKKRPETLADIVPQSVNANKHTQRGMGLLERSISERGWIGAITTAANGETFDGSARRETLEALSMDDAIIVRSDGSRPVVLIREDIPTADDPRAVQLALEANRIGQLNLEWDAGVLAGVAEDHDVSGLFYPDELSAMLAQAGTELVDGTGDTPATPEQARASLADRFGVPPFSVLDARQGYWQARKRAWIALGIQSELGRGDGVTCAPSDAMTDDSLNLYRKQNAAPGGAPKGEARLGVDGHTERGDGHGRRMALDVSDTVHRLKPSADQALKHSKARNGAAAAERGGPGTLQESYKPANAKNSRALHATAARDAGDLRETASLRGGLSWGTTIHPYDKTGEKRNGQGVARSYAVNEWVRDALPDQTGLSANQSGTSIFDPVLCELAYRWFCPEGGAILDPFAGGSVRGVVASLLGRAYTGIDLRPEQIAANEAQAADILATKNAGESATVQVKVSAAMARLRFNGCDPEYIRTTCHASCCESSTSATGTMITIHPSEVQAIEARGGCVVNGLLQPRAGEHKCSFKTGDNLCGLHLTPDKPFGCIASPFTLNSNGTLIVRNRYKLLKCYDDGPRLPAYVAFRASLDLIFGLDESQRIHEHLEAGGGDLVATMPRASYQRLVDNDAIKHGAQPITEHPAPRWLVGDSRDAATLAPGAYDLIFSCPPYADLEVYSDDPRDLSTLEYGAFIESYRAIIAASVAMLNDNRFAVFVVGDIRDKKGFYRNFVSDTIQAFEDAGALLYNEAILVTAVGSLPIRVAKQFEGYRKLGKTHQNVLCFYKGDPKAIKDFGAVEMGEPEELAEQGGDRDGIDL